MRNVELPRVLIITVKSDVAADYVVWELRQLGVPFMRLNTEDFPLSICSSVSFQEGEATPKWDWLSPCLQPVDTRNVQAVWYRRHRLPVLPERMVWAHAEYALRESDWFLKGAISSLASNGKKISWMSHPLSIQRAESKIEQLRLAKLIGFNVPRTLIGNDPVRIREFFRQCGGTMVAKPLRLGYFDYGERQTCVYTSRVASEEALRDESLHLAPVIFQEQVPKLFDIRVTLVGERVYPVKIDGLSSSVDHPVDWRQLPPEQQSYELHLLPEEIAEKCLAYAKEFDLNYGAYDFILTPGGKYVFLEVNPSGQWLWLEDSLELPISKAIARWLFERSGG